jgi:hypothetical protein
VKYVSYSLLYFTSSFVCPVSLEFLHQFSIFGDFLIGVQRAARQTQKRKSRVQHARHPNAAQLGHGYYFGR